MYLYLVGDNSEHKKVKGVNRNAVATISRNEYEYVCWIKSVELSEKHKALIKN